MLDLNATFYDPDKTFDDNFDHGPFVPAAEPFVNAGEPAYDVLGHKVYSPFGIPAGPLPTSAHVKGAFERGFDVVCYKTQRSLSFPCNDFPNVLFLDVNGDLTLELANEPLVGHASPTGPIEQLSITNSFGNPSRGPEFWVDDLKKAVNCQGKGQLLIMSVVGTIKEGFSPEDYYDDFATAAELAAATGVQAIEVNLSCPNVASEGVLCYTRDAVVSICRKTKERIGDTPLIAKIGYYTDEQQPLLESVVAGIAPYVSAIASINTLSAAVVNEQGQQALPGPGRLKSGICGAGIKWAGLDMTRRLHALREQRGWDYQIFGIGGVMTPDDFHEYRQAGADVVQSATAAMWNPLLAQNIKATL